MSDKEMLLNYYSKDYDRINMVCENYFERLYKSLNFTIVLYGGILAYLLRGGGFGSVFSIKLFMFYVLPIVSYIFGVLFNYNGFVLVRGGYYMILLEKRINDILGKYAYEGWNKLSKRENGHFVLVYGPTLFFFLLFPAFDFFIGAHLCNIAESTEIINNHQFLNSTFGNWVLPLSLYVLYFVFMLFVIVDEYKLLKVIKKEITSTPGSEPKESCCSENNN